MVKTLYEGYRVGKNGGERWSGTTINREPKTGRFLEKTPASAAASARARKVPAGGSAFSSSASSKQK